METATERHSAPAVSADQVLELERVFDAPRELVFRLWSSPEHIARWWGPKGYHLSSCTMDFREGGAWRFCMQPDASPGHWIRGVYAEIRAPERLSFSYINESDGHAMRVELDFIALGNRTRMKFRQTAFKSVAARDGHRGGWSQSFDIFDRYLRLYQQDELGNSRLGWREVGEGADLRPGTADDLQS